MTIKMTNAVEVYFAIKGDNFAPDAFTTRSGLTPTEVLRAGEPGKNALIDIIRFFSLLAQRKETKRKGTLPLGPADFLALLETAGILQTRFAQTVQNPFRQLLRCSASANGNSTPRFIWPFQML